MSCGNAVLMCNAVVDHPHRLGLQCFCQLEVLEHTHACKAALVEPGSGVEDSHERNMGTFKCTRWAAVGDVPHRF